MRRALATAALVGGVVLTPAVVAGPAHAAPVVTQSNGSSADTSSSDNGDGSDHKGRWGLAGLLGMTGLFGYKKYRDGQASRTGASVGGVDTDGSGSRRL